MMKKMRRLIAISVSGLLAMATVLAMPVTSLAKEVVCWDQCVVLGPTGDDGIVDTDIPMEITINSAKGAAVSCPEGIYMDMDLVFANMSEEEKERYAEVMAAAGGMLFAEVWVGGELPDDEEGYPFQAGDTITIQLPFSGSLIEARVMEDYLEDIEDDSWVLAGSTSNSITLECVADSFGIDAWIMYKKTSATESGFWFKPMKTQLAIAAEVAEASGKEAVAEVSGDFGLSYEIMKWLEDHPNVTLKYTLSYQGAEHLIVIKGGQKLANPDIPWYGPEYLIGFFGK